MTPVLRLEMASNTSVLSYKYQFISEPDDDLKCLICLDIAEEPWQHGECGRLFCEKCLSKLGRNKPCPNCRYARPQYFKDGRSKRATKVIPVKCDNVERGCTWVGIIGTLEEHVATCVFTLLPCPKECKEDSHKVKQFMRKDLDKHLERDYPKRDYSCKHCRERGTYASIQVHNKTCKKKEVTCPKVGCGETVERQSVSSHIATKCKHAVISCKYANIGCERKLKRKDMGAHEQDSEVHLSMALDTINVLQNQCKYEEQIKFKLTDFEARKERNEGVLSPSYYTSSNSYHVAFEVYANGNGDGEGTHVSVFACFMKEKTDAQLKWPFVGKITFTLLNQLEDKNHHHVMSPATAADNVQVGEDWGKPQFIPHSALGYNRGNNTQYLKDDTLYFRMSVEPADHKPWLQ